MLRRKAASEEVAKDMIMEERMDDDGSTPATYNGVCDYFLSKLYSGAESTFPEEHVRLSHLASAIKHQNWDYAICHVTAASGGNLTHCMPYCSDHIKKNLRWLSFRL